MTDQLITKILEYGLLGIFVLVLAWIVYHFVIKAKTTEITELKAEKKLLEEECKKDKKTLQNKIDKLLADQLDDYKVVIEKHTHQSREAKVAFDTNTEVLEQVMEYLPDADDEDGE